MSTLPKAFQRGSAAIAVLTILIIVIVGLIAAITITAVHPKITTPSPSNTNGGNMQLSDFNLKIQSLLQVTVVYNKNLTQPFNITTIKKREGFLKRPIPHRLHYTIQLLDQTGQATAAQPFIPSDEIEQDAFNFAGQADAQTKFVDTVTLNLEVPWISGGKSVRILSPNGLPLVTHPLSDSEISDSLEQVSTILDTTISHLSSNIVPQAFAQSPLYELPNKLTIAFIPEGYGDMTKDAAAKKAFETDLNTQIAALKTIEPYKSRWNNDVNAQVLDQINFDFCTEVPVDQRTSQKIEDSCSFNGIIDGLTTAKVNPDITVVFANYKEDTDFSFVNQNNSDVVVSSAMAKQDPGLLAHELGHAIGKLLDERVTSGSTTFMPNEMEENCFAGSATPNWHGLEANPHNSTGCAFSTWQASQADSLMHLGKVIEPFDAISLYFMNAWLDFYTGKSGVPQLAMQRLDLSIEFENHTDSNVSSCPAPATIAQNRATTPETCQYLHPIIDIHDPTITQQQLDDYTTKYESIFINGKVGDDTEFKKRLQFIVDEAKQAEITPQLALGLWKSESNFSTATVGQKYHTDLGCEPGNPADAPDFYAQVLCVYGLDGSAQFGSTDNYAYPTGFPIPFCIRGNAQACQTLQDLRNSTKKNPPTYSNVEKYVNDPITLPFINFDDVFEAYGPRTPILNDDGSPNENCVHSYNDSMEVANVLNICQPYPQALYMGFDDTPAQMFQQKVQQVGPPPNGPANHQNPACPVTPNYDTTDLGGGSNTISGVVTYHPGSGPATGSDLGFGCAKVTLLQNGLEVATVVSSGQQGNNQQAIASKIGHFTFTNVPSGTYQVEVSFLPTWTIVQPNPLTVNVPADTYGQLIYLGYQ